MCAHFEESADLIFDFLSDFFYYFLHICGYAENVIPQVGFCVHIVPLFANKHWAYENVIIKSCDMNEKKAKLVFTNIKQKYKII